MYSFASGTILSAGTCSPSTPGTQPVSLNISPASFRRAISSLAMTFLMIDSLCLAGSVRRETVVNGEVQPLRQHRTRAYRTQGPVPMIRFKPRQLRFGRSHSPALLIGVDIGPIPRCLRRTDRINRRGE